MNIKMMFAVCAAALAAAGVVAEDAVQLHKKLNITRDQTQAPAVRVMSYNVRYSAGDRMSPDNNWNGRKEDLAKIVENENPDVIGFQEVLPDQRKWLEERFRDYTFVGDGRESNRKSGESSPVAFRKNRFNMIKMGTFWLSETPDKPGSKGWDAAMPRVCSYAVLTDVKTGKRFSFANCHTDHRGEQARIKGMLLIIERMKEFGNGAPVVLVGDHNCFEFEKPSMEVKKILKDALYLSETHPEGSWRTFNFWGWTDDELTIGEALKKDFGKRDDTRRDSKLKRIDFIYVSEGTRVLDYRTLSLPRPGKKLYPSDHFPVSSTLIFNDAEAEKSKAKPEIFAIADGNSPYEYAFDLSETPELYDWTVNRLVDVVKKSYPEIVKELDAADVAPKKVTIKFKKDIIPPAYCSGSMVVVKRDWILNNPDDVGCVVHELAHAAQYGYRGTPDWICEGIADYIRFYVCEPNTDTTVFDPAKIKYDDSYRISANFFDFVERKRPGTVKELNKLCHKGEYSETFWTERFSKTLHDLGEAWKKSHTNAK
jgi:endonuclease/exonuclease/phosphatase family metal-dependent hydrolase